MLKSFRDRLKNLTVTLRFSILSVFVMLFIVTMTALVIIYFFQIKKIVMHASLLLMNKTAYTILYDLDSQLRPAQSASELSANNIRERILDISNQSEASAYMIHLLNRLPLSQGVYWGDAYGNLIYTRRQSDGTFITQVINRHANPPTNIYIYLDKHHNELKRVAAPVSFDPRTRPWYILAAKEKRMIWTDVYAYPGSSLGITVATPAIDEGGNLLGVFGVDITLAYLTHTLSELKVGSLGEIFILDNKGKIIASSNPLEKQAKTKQLQNIHTVSKPWLLQAFTTYQNTKQSLFQFKNNDETYLANFMPIPILKDNGWTIGIVDVASDFTSRIHRVQLVNVLIFLFIFSLGLALMSHIVTLIVNPIKKLVKETQKIKNFDLEERERIYSPIKEVIELSNAVYAMKRGLRSFQKYVPATLVRQLIKTGEDVRIGGHKLNIAFFFSDIQDFTTITEKADSKVLVKQICDYFETLSHIIIQSHGTIDKYIGDSIMAFWGAPVAVRNPCESAAHAALRCMKFSQILNMDWAAKGRNLLVTHIGLHFGEAIVGSLGSSERLSYTALGDAVNITSRLVNANKLYGTSILVTESIYRELKKPFVLRLVDRVMLKGKEESTLIYELLSDDKQSILFDLDAYSEQFAKAFAAYQERDFKQAVIFFKDCLQIYPEDKLAPVFIERCNYFIENPPPKDWQGVWRLTEK